MSNIPDFVSAGIQCGENHWWHELCPGEFFLLSYAYMNWNTGVGGNTIDEVL